jgi:hypothetical protein
LRVAPRRLEPVPPLLRGRLVSGDARYSQKTRGRPVRAAGADDLVAVTDPQPSRHAAIARLFLDPPPGERFEARLRIVFTEVNSGAGDAEPLVLFTDSAGAVTTGEEIARCVLVAEQRLLAQRA